MTWNDEWFLLQIAVNVVNTCPKTKAINHGSYQSICIETETKTDRLDYDQVTFHCLGFLFACSSFTASISNACTSDEYTNILAASIIE